MKTGRPLPEFVAEMRRQAQSKRDFLTPMRDLSVSVLEGAEPTVNVSAFGQFAPTQHFDQQLAGHIHFPMDFFRRARTEHPAQWSGLVNAMIGASPDTRLVRTLDGSARAFLSDRYRLIDNWDVAEVALNAIDFGAGWEVHSAELTDTRMYLKVLTPLQREVKVGDVVQAGFALSNSEIGMARIRIEPLMYRLICKNGAIIEDFAIRKNHAGRSLGLGDGMDESRELNSGRTNRLLDAALVSKIQDTITSMNTPAKFEAMVARVTATTERPIADVVKATEVTAKQFGLNGEEQGGILNFLANGGDPTQYGLHNAVTAYAQTVESYDRATELERIGGMIIDLPPDNWKMIASAN